MKLNEHSHFASHKFNYYSSEKCHLNCVFSFFPITSSIFKRLRCCAAPFALHTREGNPRVSPVIPDTPGPPRKIQWENPLAISRVISRDDGRIRDRQLLSPAPDTISFKETRSGIGYSAYAVR